MLLQRVLGSGPHVKRGTGQGKLAKAASAASAGNFAVGGNCFFYAIWEKRHLVFTSSTNSKKKIIKNAFSSFVWPLGNLKRCSLKGLPVHERIVPNLFFKYISFHKS